ncbi:MAG: hypothetical protein MI924_30955 [Chloroflexales bacterium]|nr:hypothetical protein [Chloroflexales bacterium]
MVRSWRSWDWVVWISWSITISIGWGICHLWLFVMALGADPDQSTPILPTTPLALLSLIQDLGCIWGVMSVIQAGLLLGYIRRISWWMLGWSLVTVIGWTGLWLLFFAAEWRWLPSIAGSLIGSLGLGIMQWLVLRLLILEPGRRRLYWWLLVYGGAALASGGVFLAMVYLIDFVFVIPGIVYGIMTGLALVSLFQSPHTTSLLHVTEARLLLGSIRYIFWWLLSWG